MTRTAAKAQMIAPPAVASRGRALWLRESDRWSIFILVILVGLIALPILRLWIGIYGDWAFHAVFAEQMRIKGAPSVPHFAYHAVLVGVQKVLEFITGESQTYALAGLSQAVADPPSGMALVVDLGKRYTLSSLMAGLLFVELLALVLWFSFRRALTGVRWADGEAGSIVAIALTVAVLFAGPIAALARLDGRMYLGYIGLNVWHSPTVLLAKPLAVLCFFYVADIFRDRPPTLALPRSTGGGDRAAEPRSTGGGDGAAEPRSTGRGDRAEVLRRSGGGDRAAEPRSTGEGDKRRVPPGAIRRRRAMAAG